MRRSSALLVLVACTAAASTDARPLLFDAVAAPQHYSYVGQVSTIRSGSARATAVVTKLEHLAPDHTRRTFVTPRALYGQYVITLGASVYDFDPAKKRVVLSRNRAAIDPTAIVDDIALLDANYRAVRTGGDNIAERNADVVDLVGKRSGERAMRIWLDRDTHVVLAREAYHADGSLAWRTRFEDIRYTGDIPAAVFNVAVPSGFTTVQGRSYGEGAPKSSDRGLSEAIKSCGFTPLTPRRLPDGFSIVSADVGSAGGTKTLHLVYSDGIRTVSLFQNAGNRAVDFGPMRPATISFDGHNAQYVRDGPTVLLGWREKSLAFALVGDLEIEDLVAIAKSVVP